MMAHLHLESQNSLSLAMHLNVGDVAGTGIAVEHKPPNGTKNTPVRFLTFTFICN